MIRNMLTLTATVFAAAFDFPLWFLPFAVIDILLVAKLWEYARDHSHF